MKQVKTNAEKAQALMKRVKKLEKPPEAVLEFFRQHGRVGGLVGGRIGAENMTAIERKRRARAAGKASGEARARKAATAKEPAEKAAAGKAGAGKVKRAAR